MTALSSKRGRPPLTEEETQRKASRIIEVAWALRFAPSRLKGMGLTGAQALALVRKRYRGRAGECIGTDLEWVQRVPFHLDRGGLPVFGAPPITDRTGHAARAVLMLMDDAGWSYSAALRHILDAHARTPGWGPLDEREVKRRVAKLRRE